MSPASQVSSRGTVFDIFARRSSRRPGADVRELSLFRHGELGSVFEASYLRCPGLSALAARVSCESALVCFVIDNMNSSNGAVSSASIENGWHPASDARPTSMSSNRITNNQRGTR